MQRTRSFYGPVFPVNSAHHQALGGLGQGLRVTAWSESGLAEAAELPGYPLMGVQFHPERMSFGRRRLDTVDGASLFAWFLGLCRGEDQSFPIRRDITTDYTSRKDPQNA